MAGAPDPKPVRVPKRDRARPRERLRIIDPDVLRATLANHDECAACERPPANGHHVLPRGAPHFGDDVAENIAPVCGSGSFRCHGALHGSPYTDQAGRRWTQRDVEHAIGATIVESRPDTIAYVLGKLGDVPGRDYLQRRYGIQLIPATGGVKGASK